MFQYYSMGTGGAGITVYSVRHALAGSGAGRAPYFLRNTRRLHDMSHYLTADDLTEYERAVIGPLDTPKKKTKKPLGY